VLVLQLGVGPVPLVRSFLQLLDPPVKGKAFALGGSRCLLVGIGLAPLVEAAFADEGTPERGLQDAVVPFGLGLSVVIAHFFPDGRENKRHVLGPDAEDHETA
jgi:hypothetical protein